MKFGAENRTQLIAAAVLGVILLVTVIYEFTPSSSTSASTASAPSTTGTTSSSTATKTQHHGPSSAPGKKARPPQNLDPTLQLALLASAEQIKYEGSGRNIFVAQADAPIPTPVASGATDHGKPNGDTYTPPPVAPAPPIPLKFFGFANNPGQPKKIFLSKGEDVFIAGEGEIVDRRYKVVRITPTSVDIQDVVGSGPPQSIPLTQG